MAFALTIAIEVHNVMLVARRRDLVLDAVLINLATHPLAWVAATVHPRSFVAIEIAVATAEWGGYVVVSRLGTVRAAFASVLANAVTAAAALVVWP